MCSGHPFNINLHDQEGDSTAWLEKLAYLRDSINFSYTDLYTSPTQGSFFPKLSYMSPLREPIVVSPVFTRRKLSSLDKASLFYSFLFAKLDTRLRSYYAATNFVTCSSHPSKGWACFNMHDHPSKSWSCPHWLDLHGHEGHPTTSLKS